MSQVAKNEQDARALLRRARRLAKVARRRAMPELEEVIARELVTPLEHLARKLAVPMQRFEAAAMKLMWAQYALRFVEAIDELEKYLGVEDTPEVRGALQAARKERAKQAREQKVRASKVAALGPSKPASLQIGRLNGIDLTSLQEALMLEAVFTGR